MSTNSILATAPLVTTNYLLRATGTTIGNSLIWDNGTNVGIGNTNPSYTLDVSGSLRSTNTAYFATTSGVVGIGTTSVNASTILAVAGSNTVTDARGMVSVNSTNASAADLGGSISLGGENGLGTSPYAFAKISGRKEGAGATYSGYLSLATTFSDGTITERMRITSAGLVGIGTIAPNAGLEVVTDSGSFNALRLVSSRAYNLSTDVALTFRYLYDTTNYTSGGLIVVAKDNTTISNQSGNMQFYTNNAGTVAERMRITSAGNVGIGTTTPTGKLDVASRGITVGSMPAGSVIQVVSFTYSTAFSTGSNSDTDTGLTLSITPTSSTSKILVIITAYVRATNSGGNCYIFSKVWRGSSSLTNGYAAMGNFNSSDIRGVDAINYLDSPATTSSTTYKYTLNSQFASTVYMNSTTSPSTITLMEIAQ